MEVARSMGKRWQTAVKNNLDKSPSLKELLEFVAEQKEEDKEVLELTRKTILNSVAVVEALAASAPEPAEGEGEEKMKIPAASAVAPAASEVSIITNQAQAGQEHLRSERPEDAVMVTPAASVVAQAAAVVAPASKDVSIIVNNTVQAIGLRRWHSADRSAT